MTIALCPILGAQALPSVRHVLKPPSMGLPTVLDALHPLVNAHNARQALVLMHRQELALNVTRPRMSGVMALLAVFHAPPDVVWMRV